MTDVRFHPNEILLSLERHHEENERRSHRQGRKSARNAAEERLVAGTHREPSPSNRKGNHPGTGRSGGLRGSLTTEDVWMVKKHPGDLHLISETQIKLMETHTHPAWRVLRKLNTQYCPQSQRHGSFTQKAIRA